MSVIKIALQHNQNRRIRKSTEVTSAEVSPDSKCAICLDLFNNISYLDLCLHKFCFRCIHEWSKNKAECPLCKQPFNSIYHTIKSEQDFKKYDLKPTSNGSFGTFGGVRFRYRTTVTGVRRQIKELYRQDVRVRSVRDGGRSRDTSAEFYRRNPACLHRLVPWLKRELAVIYGAHGSLELRPFLQGCTEHFLHEFISFAKSPFNMEAYDQQAVYDCPGSSSANESSSNSSVIAISEDDTQSVELDPPGDSESNLSHTMWDDETPGPSYSTQTEPNCVEQLSLPHLDSDSNQITPHNDDFSSDSEDCVIVGFVKPTTDRTPELVQLSSNSSDDSATEDDKDGLICLNTFVSLVSVLQCHKAVVQLKPGCLTKGNTLLSLILKKDARLHHRLKRGHIHPKKAIETQAKIHIDLRTENTEGEDDLKVENEELQRTTAGTGVIPTPTEMPIILPTKGRTATAHFHTAWTTRSRTYSSSRSPSLAKRKSHNEKPGGKRKYKTRHLEEPGDDAKHDSSKHRKKSKEKYRRKSLEELNHSENSPERSKRHRKKKKKHKKKSKRHRSNERREKPSLGVITIDSDSDNCLDKANCSNMPISPSKTSPDPAEPLFRTLDARLYHGKH
uniref:E3 ubiquitin-protein ligase Topors n=1 Tax=Neogobius melanostomus TaxID=47308 RepID=A0A8C6T8C9_9GOBI